MRATQTGRTHDRTGGCCSNAKKALANQALSPHDPLADSGRRRTTGHQPCQAVFRIPVRAIMVLSAMAGG